MGIGRYAEVLPLLLTHRPLASSTPLGEHLSVTERKRLTRLAQERAIRIKEQTNTNTNTSNKSNQSDNDDSGGPKEERKGEQEKEQVVIGGTSTSLAEASEFLDALPEDMLFVLKTQNYVRCLNKDLGTLAFFYFSLKILFYNYSPPELLTHTCTYIYIHIIFIF